MVSRVLIRPAVSCFTRPWTFQSRRVVVLLDAFQEIGRLGREDLAKRMRATWQRQKHTAYLLLGSDPTIMARLFTDRHAALYRFADVLPVPVPDRTAWARYLPEKFRAAGTEVTPPAVSLLLDLTGGHPDDTVRAANEAFSLARSLGHKAIDMDTVQEAVDRTTEWLSPAFQAQLDGAGRTGIARAVLRDLAHGERMYRDRHNPSFVRRAVDHLIGLSTVEKTGRGQYRFVEPLLARSIRHHLP